MITALLALVLLQDHAPGDKGKIEWAADLESAMAQGAKDGRPVITYFTFEG